MGRTVVETADAERVANRVGPLGRLGIWSSEHRRLVALSWVLVVVGLGIFAPAAERGLAGAGWQADGSESVAVRDVAVRHFGGNASDAIQVVVHSRSGPLDVVGGRAVIDRVVAELRSDDRIGQVVTPVPGASLSPDGRTAVVLAGANAGPDEMVRAATDLKVRLQDLSTARVDVDPTGASVLWSDFNESNLEAMLSSELHSWPGTVAILLLAFGGLVAAGLPLVLTLSGLVASAGSLVLINHVVPVSIWAMNFAMMFSLALGFDYALFLVVRYRAARTRHGRPDHAIAETMDTAGKAVLLSGLTVLVSLSAVMLVPAPAFRSAAGGIMLSVAFVLAATLTLLPLLLVALDHRINRWSLPWFDASRRRSDRFAAWGALLWRRPAAWGVGALLVLAVLAAPVLGLRTAMPSVTVLPADASARIGYHTLAGSFGPGAPGFLQIVTPGEDATRVERTLAGDPGIAAVLPTLPATDGTDRRLVQAVPSAGPSDGSLATTVARLRSDLPSSALVGGPAVESLDLKAQLDASTPVVIGVVLVLGFLLLLVALQAPLISVLGTLASLLSTAAAFGAARLVFQDGHGERLLGFEHQGFVDAWAPVFFFAMIFAIAMDYTVFLLAAAKESWERHGDARVAMVEALAHSGPVIFAAGGVMVAVFLTFTLSGPLPPKEMGLILGLAVLLDAFLVRLVLLPVMLRLAGSAAWVTPRWLRRVLPTVTFTHG